MIVGPCPQHQVFRNLAHFHRRKIRPFAARQAVRCVWFTFRGVVPVQLRQDDAAFVEQLPKGQACAFAVTGLCSATPQIGKICQGTNGLLLTLFSRTFVSSRVVRWRGFAVVAALLQAK